MKYTRGLIGGYRAKSAFGKVLQEGDIWEQKVLSLKKGLNPDAIAKHTPCFLYDSSEVVDSFRRFFDAFDTHEVDLQPYYAVKSNPYSGLLKSLVAERSFFDISSTHEFNLAYAAGGRTFVYTGPAKREKDIRAILSVKDIDLIVHLESRVEIDRVIEVAKKLRKRVRCGVRVNLSNQKHWSKFGVPLEDLADCVRLLNRNKETQLEAIHFHMSYAKTATPYILALKELCRYGKKKLTAKQREAIKLVDIGGGFTPEAFEAEYAWNPKGVLLFEKKGLVEDILSDRLEKRFHVTFVEPIEEMATRICDFFNSEVRDTFPNARLGVEPGRYFSHASMHIGLTVVDQKDSRSVIVDGGWNMIGWEKYQYLYYAPIINLSSFSLSKETRKVIQGSLCIPEDVWGYYTYGKGLKVGDILILPYQGAYTYTYTQSFIRGLAPVINL